ncbi:MAG: glucosamine-6-phosphate deaminase [Bacteroidetes bacterium]|jgi:glucosamine-6-phosphate deaminase|nr:glucosamine-6-phosphate deaminase [Bacteroidota bacterium]
MIEELKVDDLAVKVYQDRAKMGEAAASAVGERIVKLLSQQEYVNIVFASAPSQNEFLAALIKQTGIDWNRVNAFHVDEYIGLPENAPQKFGSFLNKKIFKHLPFHALNYINGNAPDSFAECGRYAELLQQYPSDIVCLGIGENGHLAFNDPHVADLNDPVRVKIVDLDFECRRQQVTDGTFDNLNSVPKLAITLTIPTLMAGKYIYGIVPGKNKTIAVYNTLYKKISEQCPASVLRTHPNAVLFLDGDSAALIKS